MGEARAFSRIRRRRQRQPAWDPASRCALDCDIVALNLEPISYLVALKEPWTLQKLDAVELEYRCFLQLVRDYPGEGIAPSEDCDTYWHHHILALELYLAHCQTLFGGPLLHYPFSGRMGPRDAERQWQRFMRSQRLITDLITRVQSTPATDGADHDPTRPEVPQPRRHLGLVQGA